MSGALTAGEGRAGPLFPLLPRAVGNFADSKNLSHGFTAQALNVDRFSFRKVLLIKKKIQYTFIFKFIILK